MEREGRTRVTCWYRIGAGTVRYAKQEVGGGVKGKSLATYGSSYVYYYIILTVPYAVRCG